MREGVRTNPPLALSATTLWGMHQPIDFSQFDPYFHLVKSFFTFFLWFLQKKYCQNFFRPKKEQFFQENGQKHIFLTNIGIFCFNYVISMLWDFFWGALHVCRSKIGDVENSFWIRHIFEFPRPQGCSWRDYATQEADQELKWKLRTIFVWENWVLVFLGSQSWDTKGGFAWTPSCTLQYPRKARI